MNWVLEAENKIYTIIKARVTSTLNNKYKDLSFTMKPESNDATPHFPTVYIHFLPSAEYGRTLDGLDINGIMSTIQIEVTASKSQGQNVAKEVAWATVDALKRTRYEVVLSPEIIATGNDTNQAVARMRRIIGANDTIK